MGRSRSCKVDAFKSKIQAYQLIVGIDICRLPEPGHSLTLNVRYGTSSAIDETGEKSGNWGAYRDGLHDLCSRLRRGPPVFYPNPISRWGLWPRPGFIQRPTGQRFLLGR